MDIAAWGNGRGRGWATAVEEVVASLMPVMEVAGATVAPGATAMVHGVMVVVLIGIGKTPSH